MESICEIYTIENAQRYKINEINFILGKEEKTKVNTRQSRYTP